MGKIIYGSEIAAEIRAELKQKTDAWNEQGYRRPHLSVILAGDNPASLSYVKGKEKACDNAGIEWTLHHLAEDTTQEELEAVIRECNENENTDGILLQLPLPEGLDENSAIDTIDPVKDVDGLTLISTGLLHTGREGFVPCTPKGVMTLLERMDCPVTGMRAVVLGRSRLVGAPVARLLQNHNATVTVCHSRTPDLKAVCQEADILVAAIGHAEMIDASYIKEGAYVVDVGINRREDGKLVGDVNTEDCLPKVTAITPVPKGAGPMTICSLLENTVLAYRKRFGL